jgi:hypothetical protein
MSLSLDCREMTAGTGKGEMVRWNLHAFMAALPWLAGATFLAWSWWCNR